MPHLGLTIVCLHPRVGLNERQHLGSWADHLSRAYLAFADDSILRSIDARVVQISFGGVEGSLLSMQIGEGLGIVRIEHSAGARFGCDGGLGVGHGWFCLVES